MYLIIDTYVFKICTMSDVGTLQYSDESDPIVISADEISTDTILVANEQIAFSYADPDPVANQLLRRGLISKENEAQISLGSTPSKKVTLLLTAIKHQIANELQNFRHFLNAISEAKISLLQPSDIEETLWTSYYDFVYQQYLKFLYASLDKKRTSPNQWPPSATKKFFRLAMIKSAKVQRGYIDDSFVRMTITGKVDNILRLKYPIQLEDIFKETKDQRKGDILPPIHTLRETGGQRKMTKSMKVEERWSCLREP